MDFTFATNQRRLRAETLNTSWFGGRCNVPRCHSGDQSAPRSVDKWSSDDLGHPSEEPQNMVIFGKIMGYVGIFIRICNTRMWFLDVSGNSDPTMAKLVGNMMIYRGIYHFFQTTPGQFWEWTSWTSSNKVWQFWGSSSSGVIWDYFHTSIPGMIWNYHSNPTECDIHPPWRIKDQHRINRWFIVNCVKGGPQSTVGQNRAKMRAG